MGAEELDPVVYKTASELRGRLHEVRGGACLCLRAGLCPSGLVMKVRPSHRGRSGSPGSVAMVMMSNRSTVHYCYGLSAADRLPAPVSAFC